MRSHLAFLAVACLLSVTTRARADVPGNPPYQPPPPGVSGPPPLPPAVPEVTHPRRVFSLTISPIHLFLPIVELTGEARVHDKVGVAVLGGAGRYSDTQNGIKLSATAFEAGAQVRYYLLGDFRHGMQLGAEFLYLHLSDSQLAVSGEGFAFGPFLGYKFVADVGFTFDTQLGFEYVGARAATATTMASGGEFIPLLNLNVGWSF
jgi:hypothetical protein